MRRIALSLASAGLLTGAMAGCTVSRPEGAYTPAPIQKPPTSDGGVQPPDAGTVNPPPIGEPPPPPPPPPTGGTGGNGGGPTEGDAGADASTMGPDPADQPYLALAGRYLMRADMYNVGTVKQLGLSLKLANAATYFSVAQVDYDVVKKELKMTERLCNQLFQHECQDGCDTWTTVVDQRTTPMFPYVTRPLTLTPANGTLTGASVSAALGFQGEASAPLPKTSMDPSVWNVVDGEDVREGVFTSIKATGVSQLGTNISCEVFTVQRFTSSFNATLVNGQLDGVSTAFSTTGSEAYRVGAIGNNASSCKSQAGEVLPGAKPDTVRFYKVPNGKFEGQTFWNCPNLSDFNGALPAK